jgi:hypothetical protein
MVFLERAGPGLAGFFGGFVEGFALEDEGGGSDGLVGWGRQAALGGGEKSGGGVQADGLAE